MSTTSGEDSWGRPIYVRSQGRNFVIVVEARRGPSNAPVGKTVFNSDPQDPYVRPDLQIQADHPLGDGSLEVCDKAGPSLGGVPALPTPTYDPESQTVADALNDFACRFGVHTFSSEACTVNRLGNEAFVSGLTKVQFCIEPPVSGELELPAGADTLLTVRVRDVNGGLGDPAQIIVSVP